MKRISREILFLCIYEESARIVLWGLFTFLFICYNMYKHYISKILCGVCHVYYLISFLEISMLNNPFYQSSEVEGVKGLLRIYKEVCL